MIFRTLLFFVLMYLLIKLISRLFLPSDSNKKSRNGSGFFYRMYQQQQSQQNSNNRNTQSSSGSKQQFDQIEEAEFEDITDEEKTSSESSD